MEKGLLVQKFGPWKVEITSDNLHHGKEFPFPDGAIEKVMEYMMVLAKRRGDRLLLMAMEMKPTECTWTASNQASPKTPSG